MKNWWLKFGCFLIGYNYEIVKSSSEATAKQVKKYTSAILIVSLLWAFIGFSFSERYIHLDLTGSIIGALIMVFVVIQIERQIILNVGKNNWSSIFRVLIAIVMAILGSIIIDQIIFKDDINRKKEEVLDERVDELFSKRIKQKQTDLNRVDSMLLSKNNERIQLLQEISETPIINLPSYEYKRTKTDKKERKVTIKNGKADTTYVPVYTTVSTKTSSTLENPKTKLIPILDSNISKLEQRRAKITGEQMDARENLRVEESEKGSFLMELELMEQILFESKVAFFVWSLWFLFLIFIELFVVTSKMGKKSETDYDVAVLHQRDVRIDAINKLTAKSKQS